MGKNELNVLDNEFYVITMNTYNNKTLYLKSSENSCEWTFDYSEAMWFENEADLKKFANKYFKHFKNWEIKLVYA